MRYLPRDPLPHPTMAHLATKTELIRAKPIAERSDEARRLWRQFDNQHSRRLRDTLREMSSGLDRCMYCEDGQGTSVDHHEPIARNPGRTFDWSNHFLACSHCNSNEKRDKYPITGAGISLLIDPTVDDPRDHILLTLASGEFAPLTPKGTESRDTFGLNRWICVQGRQNALAGVGALCVMVDRALDDGDEARAARFLRALHEHPFSTVRLELVRAALTSPDVVGDPEVVAAICNRSELQN